MFSPFLEKMRAAARRGFDAAHRNGAPPPPTAATTALLEKAAWEQDTTTVRSLITQWPQLVNHAAHDGLTVLHAAAASMDGEHIEWLLARGAKTDARDNEGNTPLHYAAQAPYATATALLLKAQAPVNITNNRGETPLYYAVMFERPDSLHLLVGAGARDDAARDDGETPRSLAPKNDKQRRGDIPPAQARPDMLRALDDAQAARKKAFESAPVLAQDMTIATSPAIRKRNAHKP